MIETTIELRRLDAAKNMVLTNGEAFSDPGGFIILSCNDSCNNWYEITEEEANKIKEETFLKEEMLRISQEV